MNRLKVKILNFTLQYLFNADTKKMKIEKTEDIQKEAQYLSESELLNVILSRMEQEAKRKMFNESTVIDHIVFPKATLYTIDRLRKVIQSLKQEKPKKTPPKRW